MMLLMWYCMNSRQGSLIQIESFGALLLFGDDLTFFGRRYVLRVAIDETVVCVCMKVSVIESMRYVVYTKNVKGP